MHILVVEDEKRLAYLLRRVLQEERHTVDLAHDGTSGLDLALSDTYDVIILHLMLPGLDGLEICRQMRAEKITTPVLMLTARGAIERGRHLHPLSARQDRPGSCLPLIKTVRGVGYKIEAREQQSKGSAS
jgi:DNA-binding response OmpR family regulator